MLWTAQRYEWWMKSKTNNDGMVLKIDLWYCTLAWLYIQHILCINKLRIRSIWLDTNVERFYSPPLVLRIDTVQSVFHCLCLSFMVLYMVLRWNACSFYFILIIFTSVCGSFASLNAWQSYRHWNLALIIRLQVVFFSYIFRYIWSLSTLLIYRFCYHHLKPASLFVSVQ